MISMSISWMTFITVTVFISIGTLAPLISGAPSDSEPHHIQKRHILQMCELIATHTNRGCLDYNNYGCFCGLGNAASSHVDSVDGCCRMHDRCYGEVACFWLYPQFVGYSVDCSDDNCTCTDSQLFSPCAYTTCRCDLEFAQCLGRAQFNHAFSDFDRRECNRTGRRYRKRRRTAKKQWREMLKKRKQHRRRREGNL